MKPFWKKERPLRALTFVSSAPWAVLPEVLDTIAEIASLPREIRQGRDVEGILRQVEAARSARTGLAPEALQARRGRPVDGAENLTLRGNVAVLSINGVVSRYSDFFTLFSGGATLESIAADFETAMNSPQVEAVLLEIDSPGGEAAGIAEFAAQVYAARGKKRCVAYVEDLGASAAYWIGAAASELVIGSTARVGSIGVLTPILDTTKAEESRGIKRFIIRSSQSPKKAPDPTSPEGQEQIRAMLDATADVFVGDIARYRGTTRKKVLEDFGQGDVLVGQAAVVAGLADRLGDFESVLAELQGKGGTSRTGGKARAVVTLAGAMDSLERALVGDAELDAFEAALIEEAIRAGWTPPGAAAAAPPVDPQAEQERRLREAAAARAEREAAMVEEARESAREHGRRMNGERHCSSGPERVPRGADASRVFDGAADETPEQVRDRSQKWGALVNRRGNN